MKKLIFFIALCLTYSIVFAQINFEKRINIYDYDSLSIDIFYDDYDNDGDLDILKNIPYNSRYTLLQKNNNGDFNAMLPTFIGSGASPIASLDLNNDNFPDLITYHSFNTIGVLYNLHNDTFGPEVNLLNFSGSYSIKPIKFDYNKDGFIDLIVIDVNNDAYVLINNQASGFNSPKFLLNVDTFDNIYQISDFDYDGDFDIYVSSNGSINLFLNKNGEFVKEDALRVYSKLGSYGFLDFDNNGYQDILYWEDDALRVKYFDYDRIRRVYFEKADKLAVSNIPYYIHSYSGNLMYMENDGNGVYTFYTALETTQNHYNIFKTNFQNGVFSAAETVLSDLHFSGFVLNQFQFLDINKDNSLDFVFTNNGNNQNMILINNNINDSNDKTICVQQSIWPNQLSVIDMNGDGVEDIAMGTQNGLAYIEKTTDRKPNSVRNLIGVMANPNASSYTLNNIVDFNNDGIGDVVDFVNFREYIKVYKNLGNDNFEYIQDITIPNLSSSIYFVDIDSDGFLDIIIQKLNHMTTLSEFNWAKNKNGNGFEALQPLIINRTSPISTNSLDFADFNNDNQMDILLLNEYYDGNKFIEEVLLLENNNGQFNVAKTISLSGSYSRGHIKIKDYNQDGNLDFFVYNIEYDQPFMFYRNLGSNEFTPIKIGNLNIEDIEFDDNDGDGILEIYAWNYYTNTYRNTIFYYKTLNYKNFLRVNLDKYIAFYDSSDPLTRGDLLLYDYNYDNKKDLFISNYSSFYALVSVYNNGSTNLDVEDIDNSNTTPFKVFPNPFVDSIHWIGLNNENYKVKLFSLEGRMIFQDVVTSNSLDLSTYKKGVYILSIEDSNGVNWRYKIIKK